MRLGQLLQVGPQTGCDGMELTTVVNQHNVEVHITHGKRGCATDEGHASCRHTHLGRVARHVETFRWRFVLRCLAVIRASSARGQGAVRGANCYQTAVCIEVIPRVTVAPGKRTTTRKGAASTMHFLVTLSFITPA